MLLYRLSFRSMVNLYIRKCPSLKICPKILITRSRIRTYVLTIQSRALYRNELSGQHVTSYKIHVTSHKIHVTSHKIHVTSHKIHVTSQKIHVKSYKINVTRYISQHTCHTMHVTFYKIQVTSYRIHVTRYMSQIYMLQAQKLTCSDGVW